MHAMLHDTNVMTRTVIRALHTWTHTHTNNILLLASTCFKTEYAHQARAPVSIQCELASSLDSWLNQGFIPG